MSMKSELDILRQIIESSVAVVGASNARFNFEDVVKASGLDKINYRVIQQCLRDLQDEGILEKSSSDRHNDFRTYWKVSKNFFIRDDNAFIKIDNDRPFSNQTEKITSSEINRSNRIYIVAGERNIELAQATGKGLWVNVGQTTRRASDRLRDDDYKRKAAGGKWVILYEQEVGNISDKEIHPFLKSHPRVKHDKSSDNTEEFLFIDDPGDGSEAIKIVSEIITSRCLPLLKAENEKLRYEASKLNQEVYQLNQEVSQLPILKGENKKLHQEVSQLQEKLVIVDELIIGSTGIELEKINSLIQENAELQQRIQTDAQSLEIWKSNETLSHQKRVDELKQEKWKSNVKWSAITGVILFSISWFLADNKYLEDLAKAQQARDIAYAALSTSDIQLKELQAKMELIQKKEVKEEAVSVKVKPSKKRDTQVLTAPAAKSVETDSTLKPSAETVSTLSTEPVVEEAEVRTPTNWSTRDDRSMAFYHFEKCIHRDPITIRWIPFDTVMSCNIGGDREMKECILPYVDVVDEVKKGNVVACWQAIH